VTALQIIVDIQEPPPNPAQEVVDVLVGSLGITGVLAVAAIVFGVAVAAFMLWRRSKSDNPLG
jgi:ABC-type phosphate transport system permease subunit